MQLPLQQVYQLLQGNTGQGEYISSGWSVWGQLHGDINHSQALSLTWTAWHNALSSSSSAVPQRPQGSGCSGYAARGGWAL